MWLNSSEMLYVNVKVVVEWFTKLYIMVEKERDRRWEEDQQRKTRIYIS